MSALGRRVAKLEDQRGIGAHAAPGNLWQAIADLIADPSLEKIVHAGQQDLEPVFRFLDRPPANIFDTQLEKKQDPGLHMYHKYWRILASWNKPT